MVLVSKFLWHQPLNRHSATYAREGIELDVSTLADRVGACVVALEPIVQALWDHVLSAQRIHADDTTVPVLAKLKTVTDLGLCPRRPAIWRHRATGRGLSVTRAPVPATSSGTSCR